MDQGSLSGKVALITGAARRIGAVIARELHAQGCTVVVHYHHSVAEAFQLQAELNAQRANTCYVLPADLLQLSQLPSLISQVIAQTGHLDILINNASSFYPTPLASLTEAHWDELIGSNLKAPLFLAQAALPYLHERRGCIINLLDIHAERPLYEHAIYCAAKAGLAMLTKSLALELGPAIRVNGVAPGAILWPEQGINVEQQAGLLAKITLRRMGLPNDIAQAIRYLIQAPYITGQVLAVDGGRTLNQ